MPNLPRPIEAMIQRVRSEYSRDKADLTTTQIIDSPRVVQLMDRYGNALPRSARSSLSAVEGTILHGILEELAKDDESLIAEKRYYRVVRGILLGGKVDLLEPMGDGYSLIDYKRTGPWPGLRETWIAQANVNRWLVEHETGKKVYKLYVCAVYTGWSEAALNSRPKGTYPTEPIVMMPVPIWAEPGLEMYVDERVKLHVDVRTKEDWELPHCTDEERWVTSKKYAIVRGGAKRATRVFDSYPEAREFLDHINDEHEYSIEEREPTSRCNYCELQSVCNQFQTMTS